MTISIRHLGLVDEDEIELDKAALEIAALDHADLDLAGYLEQLETMARDLSDRAPTASTPAAQAAALAQVLAVEARFDGDRESYDDPANADLISVMHRRRGLPVSLAILYVAMARRVGWTAHALNTPGHVLVGLGERPFLLMDPFDAGAVVGPDQLNRLRAVSGQAGMQAIRQAMPMSNREVLVRLLNNQAIRAEQAGRIDRALTVLARITTIAPAYSEGWWERSRLERSRGNLAAARAHLGSMLETTRDPGLRRRINRALDAMVR